MDFKNEILHSAAFQKGVNIFMKQFDFTIQDTLGMHPRPAGKITSSAKGFTSDITLSIGDKVVNAKKLMNVISLNGKCGETIHAVISGPDEAAAADALQAVLNAELGNAEYAFKNAPRPELTEE